MVATTIDVTNDSNRVGYEFSLVCLSCPETLCHVDVYLGITVHISLEATTKDIVNTGCRLDVHRNRAWTIIFRTISFCSRIRSLITTTKQVLDDKRLHTIFSLFDIDSNITTYTTSTVVTAKYIFEDTGFYR